RRPPRRLTRAPRRAPPTRPVVRRSPKTPLSATRHSQRTKRRSTPFRERSCSRSTESNSAGRRQRGVGEAAMAIRSALPLLGGIVALTTVAFSSAYAQAPSLPSARVVTAYPDSSYLVNIGGRNMLAITEAMADSSLKVKAEVWRLRSQLALRDS